MGEKIKKFKVIQGGDNKSELSKQHDGDIERILCHVCEQHDGVSTGAVIPAYGSLYARDNDIMKGEQRMLCLNCLLKGRHTYLV